ncbi:MFS transporter [Microbacterium sp. LMI12-1-1.1]|uniref:MFS transporter n=1 Tax=unclassified Microbacterium TaxID=2609290 RepID=UPI00343AC6F3
MLSSLSARRLALATLFFVPGVGIASWVTRTPDIRDLLGASTAQMGLVLFGLSLGSMIGILSSGALVARLGARPVITVGATAIVVSMPVIGIGAAVGSPFVVAAGLFLFGAGMGGGEVAMNVEGADIERVSERSFLPTLHGCFSLGTLVGAVIGIWATAAGFPVAWHLGLVGVIALAAVMLSVPALPAHTGRAHGVDTTAVTESRRALWKDSRLLLIGVIILAMALAEGTANDWLPLVMVDGHGFDPALGSTIYAVFAAAMTIGRFSGGWFIERFGRPAVLSASGVFAAVGLALVIFVDHQLVAAAAVLLWGLGASLGFPVAISAAGDSGPDSAARVSLVATAGYVAFLVGPPALGFAGDEFGLRAALIIPLVFVIVAALIAPLIGGRRRTPVLVDQA